MVRPLQLYLLSYNSVQALGWFVALLRLLPCPVHSSYAVASDLTWAILETIHAAIGLVHTSPLLAFLQWGGRTHFVLAVVRQIPEVGRSGDFCFVWNGRILHFCGILGGIELIHVQSSPSVFITFMAWSISEVIRYSHYALTTLKVCPPWLTYLRYTAFIPLYPIGVGPGEMWTMYQALPFVKERKLYSGFFGKFSMSYHSFLVAVLAVYPFLWMKLYLHVFKQRRSKLGKTGGAKKRA
uniref:Very-long-chain (3R)-3-hydroxyacyl-CoA dehydratase n=1 Tax=Oryza meridionalis TaxID=40149 RepID=A0A0E0DSH9_9ORYZ